MQTWSRGQKNYGDTQWLLGYLGRIGRQRQPQKKKAQHDRSLGTIRVGENERMYMNVNSHTSTESIHGNQSRVQSWIDRSY